MSEKTFSVEAHSPNNPTLDEMINFLIRIKQFCDEHGKPGVIESVSGFNIENLAITAAQVTRHPQADHIDISLWADYQKQGLSRDRE